MNSNILTSNVTTVERAVSLQTYLFLIQIVIPHLSLAFSVLGLIGFLGNGFTFLQPKLRTKPSSIYMLSSSLVDVLYLFTSVFPEYLRIIHSIRNIWFPSAIVCQLNSFLYCFLPQLSINFLLLSMIDRYAGSCPLTSRARHFNQLRRVPYLLMTMVMISGIVSIYAPILTYKTSITCGYRDPKLFSILNIAFNGILQPIVMLTFVLLTLRNFHRSRQRVGRAGGDQANRFRNQFIAMIITQVVLTATFSLAWMIGQVYVVYNSDKIRTLDDFFTITLFLSFTIQVYVLNNVKSFYFSMLTSKLYQKTFVGAVIKLLPRRWHP